MPLDLYYIPASAPCRSIMMLAKIANIELNYKVVDMAKKQQKSEEFLKMNPDGTVPTLDDNGYYLWESRAILTYLADQYGNDDSIYPKDPKKRAKVIRLLFNDLESYLKGFASWFYPQFIHGPKPADPAAEKRMLECFQKFDGYLEGKKYLIGDHITIADCSFLSSIVSLDAVDYNISGYRNLHAYIEGFKKFSWYEDIQQKGINMLRQWIEHVKTQKA